MICLFCTALGPPRQMDQPRLANDSLPRTRAFAFAKFGTVDRRTAVLTAEGTSVRADYRRRHNLEAAPSINWIICHHLFPKRNALRCAAWARSLSASMTWAKSRNS